MSCGSSRGPRTGNGILQTRFRPFLGRDVLEVGAGLGETALAVCSSAQARWVLLEPDPNLAASARARLAGAGLPADWQVRPGTTLSLGPRELFDSVLYVDVLEHIEHDGRSSRVPSAICTRRAISWYRPRPPGLFTAFDARIGHFRRYTRQSLMVRDRQARRGPRPVPRRCGNVRVAREPAPPAAGDAHAGSNIGMGS